MERYRTWFLIYLKNTVLSPRVWIEAFLIIVMMGAFNYVYLSFPRERVIALCNEDGETTDALISRIVKRESEYVFSIVSDRTELDRMISSGKAECGFVFKRGFDASYASGKRKPKISYVASYATDSGSVAKETLYSAIFEYYSPMRLTEMAEDFFEDDNEQVKASLYEGNTKILSSDRLLNVDFSTVSGGHPEKKAKRDYLPVILHIIPQYLIFATMLFMVSECIADGNGFSSVLKRGENYVFRFIRLFSSALVLGVFGFIGLVVFGVCGAFFIELSIMLGLCLVLSLLISFYSMFFKSSALYIGTVVPLLFLALMISIRFAMIDIL